MEYLMGSMLVSGIVASTIIAVGRGLAERLGLVDVPAGHKTHENPVPVIGGLAIFAGLTSGVAVMEFASGGEEWIAAGFVGLCAIVLLVGLADDWQGLSVYLRFLLHSLVGLGMAKGMGILITDLGHLTGDGTVGLGVVAIPFTVFATIGGINAMNMADGVDGFAGSLAFITLASLAVVAATGGQGGQLALLLVLLGSVAGFLVFNLRWFGRARAEVFLGDSGSTLLGFAITWFLIALSQGSEHVMPPVLALWLFALPLMDTVVLMIRRTVRGRSPFAPDHDHFHHVLLRSGFSPNQVVAAGAGVHGMMAAIGLSLWWTDVPEWLMFYAFMGVFFMYWRFHNRLAERVNAEGVALRNG